MRGIQHPSAFPLLLLALLALGLIRDDLRAEERRMFAAVLLVRGSVSGNNAGSYGVFIRADSGAVWKKSTRSNVISFGLGYFEKGATRRYYLAGGNGLHRSEDGGKTWRVLTSWRTEEILGVVPDPGDSAVLYVATPFGVFKSTDDGATWVKRMNGFKKWFIQRLIMDSRDRNMLYAASEDDVYKSTDGGEAWVPLSAGTSQILALLQAPRDPNLLVIGSENGGIRYSIDGGRTWSASRGLENSSVYTLCASGDGKDMYAGGWGGTLWHSTDNARSWTKMWHADSVEAIYSIAVDPGNAQHLVTGTVGAGIFESYDHGTTWRWGGLPGAQVKQIEFYP